MQKGFDEVTIQAAIAKLDPQPDPEAELTMLKTEAEKQWRLKQRYDERTRKQKVKTALFRKGFDLAAIRSEERRVGKECLRLCRSRWSPYH